MTVIRIVGRLAGQDSNRTDLCSNAGQDFDSGEHGWFSILAGKLEVQHAILSRANAGEDFDVGHLACTDCADHIEVRQYRASVCPNGHHPASLASSAGRTLSIDRLG